MNFLIQAGLSIIIFIISGFPLSAQTSWRSKSWKTVEGNTHSLQIPTGETLILIFLAPECPLCISYAPKLRQFSTQYSTKNKFHWVGVFPGTNYTLAEMNLYLAENPLGFTCILDPDKHLTQELQASVTPECLVLDAAGKKIYQGRIDNWAYALSKKRSVITAHDLKEVLEKRSKGEKIPFRKTQAVGCLIE
jgi:thiol-disulfide isomerase/thioredoxin